MVTVSPPVEVQVIVSLTSDVKMHRFVPFLFSCLISGLVTHPLHENLSYRAWCCHDLLELSRQCRQTIRPHTTHTGTHTHTRTHKGLVCLELTLKHYEALGTDPSLLASSAMAVNILCQHWMRSTPVPTRHKTISRTIYPSTPEQRTELSTKTNKVRLSGHKMWHSSRLISSTSSELQLWLDVSENLARVRGEGTHS